MGDFGTWVSRVATGGLSDIVDKVDPSGKTASIASGGLSDLAAGKPLGSGTVDALNDTIGTGATSLLTGGVSDLTQLTLPYSGFAKAVGPEATGILSAGMSDQLNGNASNQAMNDWMVKQGIVSTDTGAFLNKSNAVMDSANTLTVADWLRGIDKQQETGDTWAGLDRAIDPGGAVDYSTRGTGDNLENSIPGSTAYAKPVLTTVGAVIGSLVPVIGTGAGAAIGSGLGDKISSGTRNYDYGGNFANAGTAYVGGAVGGQISPAVSGAVGGGTTGAVLGGATSGAVAGGASAVPDAVQTGDYGKIGEGALYGGAIGGLLAGAGQGYNKLFGDAGATAPAYGNNSTSTQSLQEVMANNAPNYNQQLVNSLGSGNNFVTADPSLNLAVGNNGYNFSINPELTTVPFNMPVGSNPTPTTPFSTSNLYSNSVQPILQSPLAMPISQPEAFSQSSIDNAYMTNPPEGYSPSLVNTLTGGQETMRGWTIDEAGNFVPPPDFMTNPNLSLFSADPTLSLIPQVNPITDYILGQQPSTPFSMPKTPSSGGQATNPIAYIPPIPTGTFSGSSSNPETNIQHAPIGKGKSKGIKAGFAEGDDYTGLDFMPESDISRYNKQNLYYS